MTKRDVAYLLNLRPRSSKNPPDVLMTTKGKWWREITAAEDEMKECWCYVKYDDSYKKPNGDIDFDKIIETPIFETKAFDSIDFSNKHFDGLTLDFDDEVSPYINDLADCLEKIVAVSKIYQKHTDIQHSNKVSKMLDIYLKKEGVSYISRKVISYVVKVLLANKLEETISDC